MLIDIAHVMKLFSNWTVLTCTVFVFPSGLVLSEIAVAVVVGVCSVVIVSTGNWVVWISIVSAELLIVAVVAVAEAVVVEVEVEVEVEMKLEEMGSTIKSLLILLSAE